MREKKACVVITFNTTAAAIAMEKLCLSAGLPGRLIPVPRSLSADCGMAWSAPIEARDRLENAPGHPEYAGVYDMLL